MQRAKEYKISFFEGRRHAGPLRGVNTQVPPRWEAIQWAAGLAIQLRLIPRADTQVFNPGVEEV